MAAFSHSAICQAAPIHLFVCKNLSAKRNSDIFWEIFLPYASLDVSLNNQQISLSKILIGL